MTLAIIIPVKNDLRVIQRVMRISEYFNSARGIQHFSAFEITVVDDVLNKEVESHLKQMNINYIWGKTSGKGDAVFRALKTIDAPHYLIIDSDDSISIESIDQLCAVIKKDQGADFVYGVRIFKRVSKIRRLLGISQLLCANILMLSSFVQDTQCPLKYVGGSFRKYIISKPIIKGGMYDVLFFFFCDKGNFVRLACPVDWDDGVTTLKIYKIILFDFFDILFYRVKYRMSTWF